MPVRPLLWVVGVLCLAVFLAPAFAEDNQPSDPLVRVLASKGILTQAEADSIASVAPADQRSKLAQILLDKGLISTADYEAVSTAAVPVSESSTSNTGDIRLQSASMVTREPGQAAAPSAPKAPPVIPAVAPVRVLQLEPSKPGGMIPDIKLGSGAKLKFYGFFKATAVHDSYDQQGNDFPLPGFLGDTGPDGSPDFRVKARGARFGGNFEWPDIGPNTAITGRVEADFEGNFNRSNNRNISSIRSNQFNLRLAYMRIDHRFDDHTSIFALFGQDWSPFASSTLPNLLETTGLGVGFGSLYEREPQFRAGIYHNFGGPRNFTIGVEPAIALPAWGILPTDLANQLGYGERQGTDSAKPNVEGRVVFQAQLDPAKGVAPAQLIFSGMWGSRTAQVLAANVPAAFVSAFPNGATMDSNRNGWTTELQLPTRWFTFVGKYWGGRGLRWYFADEIFLPYNNGTAGYFTTAALTTSCNTGVAPGLAAGCPTGAAIDGNNVSFGFNSSGVAQVIPQIDPRVRGGFAQLSFPLSRLFNADPTGRNAGWTLSFTYGLDDVVSRDVQFFAPKGARDRSDMMVGTLMYKMNNFVTFGTEVSNYRTRSDCTATWEGTGPAGVLPTSCPGTIYRGIPAREVHDLRFEFGPVFTF